MLSDVSTKYPQGGGSYLLSCTDAANLESELDLTEEINRRMTMEDHDRLMSNSQVLLGQLFQK